MSFQSAVFSSSQPQSVPFSSDTGGGASPLPADYTCHFCKGNHLVTTFTGHVFCTDCAEEIIQPSIVRANRPRTKAIECPNCHRSDLAFNRSGFVMCKNCGEEIAE